MAVVRQHGFIRDCISPTYEGPVTPTRLGRARDRRRRDWTEQRLASLANTIEADIIPRLALTRRGHTELSPEAQTWGSAATEADVNEFAKLVLAHDVVVAASYIDVMRLQGTSLENIFLHLLAPAARRLGDWWTTDIVDFGEVTIGLCRLQMLLRQLSPAFQNESEPLESERQILLLPAPGDQHTFGLSMVGEFFHRAGWEVESGAGLSRSTLLELVRAHWFDVVGFSLSSETKLEGLASLIHAIRRASSNRAVGVMLGGRLVNERPELVNQLGGDATAIDGRRAPQDAEELRLMLSRKN